MPTKTTDPAPLTDQDRRLLRIVRILVVPMMLMAGGLLVCAVVSATRHHWRNAGLLLVVVVLVAAFGAVAWRGDRYLNRDGRRLHRFILMALIAVAVVGGVVSVFKQWWPGAGLLALVAFTCLTTMPTRDPDTASDFRAVSAHDDMDERHQQISQRAGHLSFNIALATAGAATLGTQLWNTAVGGPAAPSAVALAAYGALVVINTAARWWYARRM